MDTVPLKRSADSPNEETAADEIERASRDKSSGQTSDKSRTGRIMLFAVVLVAVVAGLIYLLLIVCGKIPADNRLKTEEIVLAIVMLFFMALLTYPEAFSRLSLIKLPGGVQLKIRELEQKQEKQEGYLDSFFAILADTLHLPEKYHLRVLGRGGKEEYRGQPALREELLRLKRFGLIEEVPGQKIGDMFDNKVFSLGDFVRLTPTGEKFIQALDKIERQ